MAGEMILKRPRHQKGLISLVPMIDVLLILLVFFMVTSTYLNLDMIPALSHQDQRQEPSASAPDQGGAMLIRLGADGVPVMRGRGLSTEELSEILRNRIAQERPPNVIVLPTGGATMQALVAVMDAITRAGVTQMRVVRLEARP